MNRGALQQIQNRRKIENDRKAVEQTIAHDRRAIQLANFEINTSKKIEHRMKQQRYEEIMRQQEKSLIERRRQLADLYNFEFENWTNEVLSKVETVEDKKNRIKERAYELREQRKLEREKFIEERLEKQWKDSLDEFRTANSMKKTREVKAEVMTQIADKIQRKVKLTEEENQHVEDWKGRRDREEQLERQRDEARTAASQQLVTQLRSQIEEIQSRKRNERDNLRRADEEEIARIREALAEEESAQRQRIREARERGEEILRYNASNRLMAEEERLQRREQERILLNYALYKEAETERAEATKRQQNKRAAEEYRNYLREQMVHEAEDTALVDRMRRVEEEKVWRARDDVLRARDEARSNLQQLVHQGRQDQISQKNQQRVMSKQEEDAWASRFIDEAREGVERERREAYERRMIAAQNQRKLEDQIKLREERQVLEQQEAYLADKLAQRNARLNTQRVEAMVRSAYK